MAKKITKPAPAAESLHKTKQAILEAFSVLKKKTEGREKFGPTELGDAVTPPLTPSLVSSHLKGLLTEGLIERCPQGTRRALYRLVETPSF